MAETTKEEVARAQEENAKLKERIAELEAQEKKSQAVSKEAPQRVVIVNPVAEFDPTSDRRLDETVPGGKYKVGDKWVDANGDELKDVKK